MAEPQRSKTTRARASAGARLERHRASSPANGQAPADEPARSPPLDERTRRPPAFPPPWAVAWGDDRHGLWADLEVAQVVQRMRWIEPGEFWMGSPGEELERSSDEGPRHRVRLTKGFWLADTACTQALWLAVVGGENPASFSEDPNNPVETVSWHDVQRFLQTLTVQHAEGSEAVLPTEAEWEYACRAGTQGPFSFGDNVTPELVNYDGNYPYANGARGEYRERTVAVKGLPPNAWGLYEMHGNVWEWCSDGHRDYGASSADEVIEDPQGPAKLGPEALRAVRGGSWLRRARNARSASRRANEPGARDDALGFRLALRSSSSSPVQRSPEATDR